MSKTESKLGYFPGSHTGNNVFSFLENHVERNPSHIALKWVDPTVLREWMAAGSVGSSQSLVHQQIEVGPFTEAICRVAAGYQELGIRKGDRAIVFIPMSVHLYTAMFALQRIGAIPVFLDSWARRNQLGMSAQAVAPKAIISFEKAFQLLKDVPELAELPIRISVGPVTESYTASLEELRRTPNITPMAAVEQEETALITFTTGSSGVPKGANRTHRFLAAQHYALDECLPYRAQDVDLPVFPIFSLNNIAAGVTTVIPAIDVGVPAEHDASVLLAQFKACGVTCATLSPSLLNGLSAHCLKTGERMLTLRRVATGGAPISRDNLIDFTAAAPNAEAWVLYGSTEVEPMAHIEAKEMIELKTRANEDPEWVDDGVNVGHLVQALETKFIRIHKGPVRVDSAEDWKALEVPHGSVGELIVAGEHVCRDYYNNTEAFSRAKILDERGVVWHRTGDLARLDGKGYLWIVGRVHNAIERDGKYEFPVRAEMILKKLDFVKNGAYLGLPDSTLGERAACVVVPTDASQIGNPRVEAEYASRIRAIMSKNGVPVDDILFRAEIPMDPRHHSKVEYEVLRKQLLGA